MSDVRFFGLCIALITAYAVLWWVTSLEPKSRRQKIQEGLRPLHAKLTEAYEGLFAYQTDQEWQAGKDTFDPILQECAQWIIDNMGMSAFTKFSRPQYNSIVWSWNGAPPVTADRNAVLNLQRARVEVIDIFLRSDGWDGTATTRAQRIKRGYNEWKTKRKGASTGSSKP